MRRGQKETEEEKEGDRLRGFSPTPRLPTFFVSQKSLRFIPLILHSVAAPRRLLQTSLAGQKKKERKKRKREEIQNLHTHAGVKMVMQCSLCVNRRERTEKVGWCEKVEEGEKGGRGVGRVGADGWLVFLRLRHTG